MHNGGLALAPRIDLIHAGVIALGHLVSRKIDREGGARLLTFDEARGLYPWLPASSRRAWDAVSAELGEVDPQSACAATSCGSAAAKFQKTQLLPVKSTNHRNHKNTCHF